jgi:ABC-type transport system substrate-binding protein
MSTIHTAYLDLDGDVVLSGLWNPVTTEWSTTDTWDDDLIASYGYDPDQAKALLAEAGYPDGFEFTVVISSDNDADLWALAQEYWAAIGVTMNIETVSNFMEAKTIGNDASDSRSCGSSGAGATSSVQAAINQTVDGGWAAGMWNGDEEYSATLNGMNTVTTTDEQDALAKEADIAYAEGHWAINLTGMRVLNYYYNNRIAGVPANCSIYSGKAANTLLSGMWVTDGQ